MFKSAGLPVQQKANNKNKIQGTNINTFNPSTHNEMNDGALFTENKKSWLEIWIIMQVTLSAMIHKQLKAGSEI